MTESEHFIPGSIDAAVPDRLQAEGVPVRLAFEPFGRRKMGDRDDSHPGYQILDARVEMPGPAGVAYLRDVAGRDLILTDGERFQAGGTGDNDLPEELRVDLGDCSPVLGVRASDREGGYVAVGVNTVVLLPQ